MNFCTVIFSKRDLQNLFTNIMNVFTSNSKITYYDRSNAYDCSYPPVWHYFSNSNDVLGRDQFTKQKIIEGKDTIKDRQF